MTAADSKDKRVAVTSFSVVELMVMKTPLSVSQVKQGTALTFKALTVLTQDMSQCVGMCVYLSGLVGRSWVEAGRGSSRQGWSRLLLIVEMEEPLSLPTLLSL